MRDNSVHAYRKDKDLYVLNDIVSWFNNCFSCSSQSCHEIMKVFEVPVSRNAVSQSSRQVNISSAQPKHNVCPPSSTHPAVKTGQAQLQAAKRESGTTSNCRNKPQLEDGDPKKSWKQKMMKLSAPSPARYTQVSWFSEEILTVHKLLDLFVSLLTFLVPSKSRQTPKDLPSSSTTNTKPYLKARCNQMTRSAHPPADPQPQTLSQSTNVTQGESLPSERTSEDTKSQ